MYRVFIGIGSNLGERECNIKSAIKLLQKKSCELLSSSSFIETSPVGFDSDSLFLNAVVEIKTVIHPEQLLLLLQQIEIDLGRTKKSNVNYENRVIDLDILDVENFSCVLPHLIIPHKEIDKRMFVLIPWAEIAPNYFILSLGQTISSLLIKHRYR